MRPDVMFQRCNIQIARDHFPRRTLGLGEKIAHVTQIGQLMGKLVILVGIRHIAACGHMKIMQANIVGQGYRHMARMIGFAQGQFFNVA